jgi:hypothetical protein
MALGMKKIKVYKDWDIIKVTYYSSFKKQICSFYKATHFCGRILGPHDSIHDTENHIDDIVERFVQYGDLFQ